MFTENNLDNYDFMACMTLMNIYKNKTRIPVTKCFGVYLGRVQIQALRLNKASAFGVKDYPLVHFKPI